MTDPNFTRIDSVETNGDDLIDVLAGGGWGQARTATVSLFHHEVRELIHDLADALGADAELTDRPRPPTLKVGDIVKATGSPISSTLYGCYGEVSQVPDSVTGGYLARFVQPGDQVPYTQTFGEYALNRTDGAPDAVELVYRKPE